MHFRTKILAAVVLLGLAIFWSRTQGAGSDEIPDHHSRLKITTHRGERDCLIHIPASCDKSKPTPLVIMLHGFGGTALNAAKETGWSAKADEESFIIVYPEATRADQSSPQSFRKNPQAWNDGSGRFHASAQNTDDVAFIEAVIDQVSEKYAIDSDRIFVTGFSNGASMAFRIGAELSHRVSAIAPVAGTSWIEKPEPSHAISVCYLTGTADTLNPMNGGHPRMSFGGRDHGDRPKPAVQSLIDQWVQSLQCSKIPRIDEIANGVRKRVYGSGREQSEVVLITIGGLGHHWPGGVRQISEFLVGQSNDTLNATDVVWEFFKSRPTSKKQ
ncbi:MAG: alpha/beta hydrolase family esterase [Planctomycetota bacterium]